MWKKILLTIGAILAAAQITPSVAYAAHLTSISVTTNLPFNKPTRAYLHSLPRKVFAHWHWFSLSPDNLPPDRDYYATQYMRPVGEGGKFAGSGGYIRERPLGRDPIADPAWQRVDMETEVRRAADAGIDGFMFNILNVDQGGGLWQSFTRMLDAAQNADSGFKVVPNIDASVIPYAQLDAVVAALGTVKSRPNLQRLPDGRVVISAFGAEAWPKWAWESLESRLGVAFMPVFVSWRPDVAPGDSYGLSLWGPGTVPDLPALSQPATQTRSSGKIWMAPIRPQDFRPKDFVYWEAQNSALYRAMWQQAMQDQAAWVQLITWNDYGEASEIEPSTGTQRGFYDLTAYYATWFKMGTPPPIARDVLYYFHRIHATTVRPDLTKQSRVFQKLGSAPPADSIELLAFLTEPGVLEIEINNQRYTRSAAAGVTSFSVPLANGTPRFRLYRSGQTVLDFASAFQVRDRITYQDLLYRGGSSNRPPVALLANPPVP
jgi:hypothetical protein